MSETYSGRDLEEFDSKADIAVEVLQNMNSVDEGTQVKGSEAADRLLKGEADDVVNEASFVVKGEPSDQNAQQMDTEKRAEMRKELEKVSQDFRKLGNEAFRNKDYEKAIILYSKAIDHRKDSPILHNNRALCYIKLELYKRAIFECDFVLNKIDEKNLRAWIYRAMAYCLLKDDENFETSINMAKKHDPKEVEYIDKLINDFKNLQ